MTIRFQVCRKCGQENRFVHFAQGIPNRCQHCGATEFVGRWEWLKHPIVAGTASGTIVAVIAAILVAVFT